jgi:hypothetical protein
MTNHINIDYNAKIYRLMGEGKLREAEFITGKMIMNFT